MKAKPKISHSPQPKPTTRILTDTADEKWQLRLYIAGSTPRSVAALTNLKKLCEEHLAGRYRIEIIDLLKNPQLAAGDQIFAIPTLVRRLPEPMKRIIGDLSNLESSLVGLDLRKEARDAVALIEQSSRKTGKRD